MEKELARVWRALEEWDQERPKSIPLSSGRAQLYRGAMEIPLVAFRPRDPVTLAEEWMSALAPTLARFGLELDCVEIGRNYKVNRGDTKEYLGRIQPDALKLHAERILALGREAFDAIAVFYLGLPPA
ncbi:MAG: hypothetical protein ACREKS_00020 [Candidatus Rokuibacteriota bacterium]